MKVAVCDDEPFIRRQVASMIRELLGGESCQTFADGKDLIAELEFGAQFDAAIMDIEWDGVEKGIGFAQKLQSVSPGTKIIYLTGYMEKYIQQVFLCPSNLCGFLVKPVKRELLLENLKKVEAEQKSSQQHRFYFKQRSELYSFLFEDILYLESAAHKVWIHTRQGKFCSYEKLETLAKAFPESFLQCHKSYLVNLNEIWKIEGSNRAFVLRNGEEIPVSKLRYTTVRDTYFHWMKKSLCQKPEEMES